MARITRNFLSESALSPLVKEALGDALSQGWHDPRKLSQHSARARILLNSALDSLATGLKVRASEIEILGEPGLAPYFSIAGLLSPADTLVYSGVDRKEVIAIARKQGQVQELDVDPNGHILADSVPLHSEVVWAIQSANAETGVVQDLETLISTAPAARIACDFSVAGTRVPLPSRWDTAIFDAKSWQGPQGVSLLLIREGTHWRNPLPHLNNLRTPQSFSLPLLIASAVALEEWTQNEQEEGARLRKLTQYLREQIRTTIEDCDIAGDPETSLPNITSFSFLYVEGEELLRRLEIDGFSVDSGSACIADDLQPSHVLAAMGLLTHGNIRITLHHGATQEDISALVTAIREAVRELRAL
ncbi:MAG: aminotransferase class V-fold PLP-dependent enzyme [Candidatus Nanopelagicaceae bacterium]|nr:aminotransferase class V-fold PLP-dependent enzyme [Candidatus Nanopelagicaceae bacterium]